MANENNLIPFTKNNAKEMGSKGGSNKKGSLHLTTHIQNMLNDPDFELKLKDGSIIKGQPIEVIMKVAISRAVSGDIRFLEWLAKYGYGQKLDLTTNGQSINVIIEDTYAKEPKFRTDNTIAEANDLAEDSSG
jgi:hypothetical protein